MNRGLTPGASPEPRREPPRRVKKSLNRAEIEAGSEALRGFLRVPEQNREIDQGLVLSRLRGMGLQARLMKGGRCVLVSLPIGEESFDTLTDPFSVSEIVFSTVGADRMKCLRPQPFFQLPMLRILDCPTPASIEARIRSAWHTHLIELRSACNWLTELRVDARVERDGTLLSAPIQGEERPVRVQVRERNRVILPSLGPLSKVTLQRAEDRVLRVPPSIRTSIDFELAVSNRMEEFVRIDARLKDALRRRAMKSGSQPLQNPATPRKHRLLLVGPRISRERPVID